MRRWLILVVAGALAAPGCSRASDDSKAQTWQQPPPPRAVEIPADLSIDVTVDGSAKAAITAATLTAKTADYADSERKAWRISGLVPEAAGSASIVEATTPAGVAVKYPHVDGAEPVLYLTRRGELAVAALDPHDPFPRFHGQGGRLRRPGDQEPHVMPVAHIAVTTRSGSSTL